jgi:hypothetical protein
MATGCAFREKLNIPQQISINPYGTGGIYSLKYYQTIGMKTRSLKSGEDQSKQVGKQSAYSRARVEI